VTEKNRREEYPVALSSNAIRTTINGYSFRQEFTNHDQAYLEAAHLLAKDVRDTLQRMGFSPILNTLIDQEDFADNHLVDKVTGWFMSDRAFTYFRSALRSGIRRNIAPVDYWAWGEMMARFVLQEAINKGVLI